MASLTLCPHIDPNESGYLNTPNPNPKSQELQREVILFTISIRHMHLLSPPPRIRNRPRQRDPLLLRKPLPRAAEGVAVARVQPAEGEEVVFADERGGRRPGRRRVGRSAAGLVLAGSAAAGQVRLDCCEWAWVVCFLQRRLRFRSWCWSVTWTLMERRQSFWRSFWVLTFFWKQKSVRFENASERLFMPSPIFCSSCAA